MNELLCTTKGDHIKKRITTAHIFFPQKLPLRIHELTELELVLCALNWYAN